MKKLIIGLALILSFQASVLSVGLAQEIGGIIPASETPNTEIQCDVLDESQSIVDQVATDKAKAKNNNAKTVYKKKVLKTIPDDLGARIHCGSVTLNDIPLLIVTLIQWVLSLAGGIAVIMIMIGGFQYMAGGVTDDKEKGKKTIIYAVAGLIVAFFAWWIVELIQVWMTQ